MKKLRKAKIALLIIFVFAGISYATDNQPINATNTLDSQNTQYTTVLGPGYASANPIAVAEGGDAYSEGGDSGSLSYSGGSSSSVNISSTTIAKSKVRIPPLSVVPPYLPYWTHGGWGIINAYFPNGPSNNNEAYEKTFNPSDPDDMKEIRGIFTSLPYSGLFEVLEGFSNSVRVVFGGPDNFHHGKGLEISNALIRDRRPQGKPLLVFIDSNIDKQVLAQAGYAYVGRISLEGDIDRTWDHAYDAAIAEALPWDVDIILISGGMKGVTVGSTTAFPGATMGYSQTNYSISLLGATTSGITEGKGKAIASAEGYRFWPQALLKRSIPKSFYDRIHVQPKPAAAASKLNGNGEESAQAAQNQKQQPGVKVSQELYDLAGFEGSKRVQNLIVE